MNFESVKTSDEVSLQGVSVEFEKINGNLQSVKLTDATGSIVRIAKVDYTGIQVLVPAKPKMVEKFAVTGSLFGKVPYEQVFDQEFTATEHLNELKRDSGYHEKLGVEVKAIQVPEKE